MPRRARIDAPGALHHIMARGIERSAIYRSNTDRDEFLERLATILADTKTPCYAWALMPNHFHLLLRSGNESISTVMRRLLAGYAQYFNRKYRRHGHLFQNRYKSILCQEDAYLLELVRYIHLNPLRAGVVKDINRLSAYRYCGHAVLMGKQQVLFQYTEAVLALFADTREKALARYQQYIQQGIAQGRREDLSGGGLVRSAGGWTAVRAIRKSGLFQKADERVLGDGDFVHNVLSQADERLESRYRLKSSGLDIADIVQRVGALLDMPPDEVVSAGKRKRSVQARCMACYWANIHLGMSQVELAGIFGVTQPAVSAAVQNGKRIIRENQFSLVEE